jgi:hypothetical protein
MGLRVSFGWDAHNAVGVILSLEERDEATRVHREARRGSGI